MRCEAALLLALSASSPFLDDEVTGQHSQRWRQFPLTPEKVPLFLDHSHYIRWVEEQLAEGLMRNERHLWTSVRPNGPRRPYDLNRLELRICDLVTDPAELIAITALLELRLLQLRDAPQQLDPIRSSRLTAEELATLADANDAAAAHQSLDATLHRWQDGSSVTCRAWIEELLDQISPLAQQHNLLSQLRPIDDLLRNGNQAMRWIHAVETGTSISALLQQGSLTMSDQEQRSTPMSGALG